MEEWQFYSPTTKDLSVIEGQIDKAIKLLERFISYQRSSSYSSYGADLREETQSAVRTAVINFEHYYASRGYGNYLMPSPLSRDGLVTTKYNRLVDLSEITNY